MRSLPAHATATTRTPEFTQATMPERLGHRHRTGSGVWGAIIVEAGTVSYRILEPEIEEWTLAPGVPGVVEPGVAHEITPAPDARFYVQFFSEASSG